MGTLLDSSGKVDGYLGDGRRIVYAEVPNPDTLKALQKEHAQLGLRFLPIHKEWAVVWYWSSDDPRRRHRQELGLPQNPDAHSIVCILPHDCSPDEAPGFVRNHLNLNADEKDVARAMEKAVASNAAQEEVLMAAAMEDVMNRVELTAKGLTEQFTENVEDTNHVGEWQPMSAKELRDIRERMREENKS